MTPPGAEREEADAGSGKTPTLRGHCPSAGPSSKLALSPQDHRSRPRAPEAGTLRGSRGRLSESAQNTGKRAATSHVLSPGLWLPEAAAVRLLTECPRWGERF